MPRTFICAYYLLLCLNKSQKYQIFQIVNKLPFGFETSGGATSLLGGEAARDLVSSCGASDIVDIRQNSNQCIYKCCLHFIYVVHGGLSDDL